MDVAIKELRKQVKMSIDHADDVTVKMIQAMLAVRQEEGQHPSMHDEWERRFAEMEQGKGKALTIDELEERARKAYAKRIHVKK